jgi:hypothetical protein
MEIDVFQQRCNSNPQSVIDDLVAQTTRQAMEIHRLNQLVEGILTTAEAAHLVQIVKSQPAEVSRDFPKEDLEEIILTKLGKIITAVIQKVKKTKNKKITNEVLPP